MSNKIIDCFLFYDEFEMLNFRLFELGFALIFIKTIDKYIYNMENQV
jgi:hypothetical protein